MPEIGCRAPARVLALATWLVAGTVSAAVPPGVALAPTQEMVRNNGSEPESLDPALVESTIAFNIDVDLFESLTAIDHHGHLVPGVAESWKQSDPTTWVFKLRKDARWSNGDPVTADDFVYAWRRYVDPKTAAVIASVTGILLANGADIVAGRKPPSELGVRALDKLTLEVKTAGPVPFLPAVVAGVQFSPQPRAIVEKYGRDWTRPGHLVGNGAYVLKDWQVNNRIVVEKNPRYWDAANVALTRVTFLAVDDDNADLKLFESGEDDMVLQIPPGSFDALKARFPNEMHNGPMLGIRFFALSQLDPLMKDARVRQALSMVLDRDLLARKVTADGQVPLYGLFPNGVAGADVTRYEWADWPMERRVAEARKLLAAAGVKPGTTLHLTYNTSEYHKRVALFAASEWKTKLGFETQLDSLEFKVLLRKRQEGDFQIARHGWQAIYNDATVFLALLACDSQVNDDKSCNRQADALVAQANAQADPARRKALLTQAELVAMADYPMIPLLQYSVPRLVKSWIGGYDDANGLDWYRSKDFYVIRH